MTMALSLGPKIRVHSLSPGMVVVRSERKEELLPEKQRLVGDLDADFLSEFAPAWGAGKSDAMKEAHPVGRLGKGEDIAK